MFVLPFIYHADFKQVVLFFVLERKAIDARIGFVKHNLNLLYHFTFGNEDVLPLFLLVGCVNCLGAVTIVENKLVGFWTARYYTDSNYKLVECWTDWVVCILWHRIVVWHEWCCHVGVKLLLLLVSNLRLI